jgi:hypothetical protein
MNTNLARKYALLAVAEACDARGVTYWSLEGIAEAAGVTARALRVHIGALERDGLIVRYRRHRRNGSRTSDLIVLCMDRADALWIADYAGRGGASVGRRVGKLAPPEQTRIHEDLAPRSRALAQPPSAAIRCDLATRSGTTQVHDHVGPPEQDVEQERDQGERAPATAATENQLSLLRRLAQERGVVVPAVGTRAGASTEIDRLMALPREDTDTGPPPAASTCYAHERGQIYTGPACPQCEAERQPALVAA